MNLTEFFEKNKKIIFIVVIIACAFLIGIISTKFFGGLFGLFGLLWGMITGKKSKAEKEHEKRIESINAELERVKGEEEKTIKEITSLKDEEEEIRKNIEKTKEKLKEMSLSDKIAEHNKMLGVSQ